jgi:hypothetical protein
VRLVVRSALSLIVLFAIACVLFTRREASASRPGVATHLPVATASADGPAQHRAPQDTFEGATDLYGNEVIDAIATYSLDPAGSLYEVHSPQTELPKLGSPKS